MRPADVWLEAARIAEAWAAIERARAAQLLDDYLANVAERAADHCDELARAYRSLAATERRAVDFDDEATEPWVGRPGMLVLPPLDDDPTDVSVVIDVIDDGPTQPH